MKIGRIKNYVFSRIFKNELNELNELNAVNKNLTLGSADGWELGNANDYHTGGRANKAMKISTVNNCVELLSNSIGKLPFFVMDSRTKEHKEHHILKLIKLRPNSYMSAFVFKKYLECQRLLTGNAYIYISRDGNGRVIELMPLHSSNVRVIKYGGGGLCYEYKTKDGAYEISENDMIHLKAYSQDGITGISVLERAAQIIDTAGKQDKYENKFLSRNARPAGIITIGSNLDKDAKDKVREEWDASYSGMDGRFKTAVFDMGMDYKPLGINQREAQFIESKEITVQDICRFFGVPLYKVQAGKQSYSSNEQNAIEYVVSTLHPNVEQWEQELTYKLLTDSEIDSGIVIKGNMNNELRGDFAARSNFYYRMAMTGSMSPNDIRAYEDEPAVPGGDVYMASKNYVPLEIFKEITLNENKS